MLKWIQGWILSEQLCRAQQISASPLIHVDSFGTGSVSFSGVPA
jgi:hypothetical protein